MSSDDPIVSPNPTFNCPICNHKMIGRTDTDENDSYQTAKCTNCKYNISPSHDAEILVLEFERYNNIPHEWSLNVFEPFYSSILDGSKSFEFRKDTRDFRIGDIVNFNQRIGQNINVEGVKAEITYVLNAEQSNFWKDRNFSGFTIFNFKLLRSSKHLGIKDCNHTIFGFDRVHSDGHCLLSNGVSNFDGDMICPGCGEFVKLEIKVTRKEEEN